MQRQQKQKTEAKAVSQPPDLGLETQAGSISLLIGTVQGNCGKGGRKRGTTTGITPRPFRAHATDHIRSSVYEHVDVDGSIKVSRGSFIASAEMELVAYQITRLGIAL